MRNLKRALSLALASVMLLGMMVVGAGAVSYPDVDDEKNVEAISVLQAVGAMKGDENGNFNPDKNVTRNEMAAVVARLLLGEEAESEDYSSTHSFTDVPEWADKYVSACYERGIVNGTSATTYSGDNTVTAQEAAAMMLRALGYEKLQGEGANWAAPIVAKAREIGLFKDVGSSGSATAVLNRNQVAQLVLNTLKATCVKTEVSGITGSVTAGDATVTLTGEIKYKEVPADTGVNYNEADDETNDGKYQQLCEKLYGKKLTLTTGDKTDDLGRPATVWAYDDDPIITATKAADYTVTLEKAPKDEEDLLKLAKKGLKGVEEVAYTLNGGSSAVTELGAGDVVEMYLDDTETSKVAEIYVTRYVLDQITDVDDDVKKDDAEDGVSYYVTFEDAGTYNDTDIPGFDAKTYVEDAYVALLITEKTDEDITPGENDIVDSYIPDSVSGSVSTYKDDTAQTYFTMGSKKYIVAADVDLSLGDSDGVKTGSDNSYEFYLDANGYVIGYEAIEESSSTIDDAYVLESIWFTETSGKNGLPEYKFYARLIALDGTVSTVELEAKGTTGEGDSKTDYDLAAVAETAAAATVEGGDDGTTEVDFTTPALEALDIDDLSTPVMITDKDVKKADGSETVAKKNNDKYNLKAWDLAGGDYKVAAALEGKSVKDTTKLTADAKTDDSGLRLNSQTQYLIWGLDNDDKVVANVYTGGIDYTMSKCAGGANFTLVDAKKDTIVLYAVIQAIDADNAKLDKVDSEDYVYVKVEAKVETDKDNYVIRDVYLPDGSKEAWNIAKNDDAGTDGFYTYSTNEDGYVELTKADDMDAADEWDDEKIGVIIGGVISEDVYKEEKVLTVTYTNETEKVLRDIDVSNAKFLDLHETKAKDSDDADTNNYPNSIRSLDRLVALIGGGEDAKVKAHKVSLSIDENGAVLIVLTEAKTVAGGGGGETGDEEGDTEITAISFKAFTTPADGGVIADPELAEDMENKEGVSITCAWTEDGTAKTPDGSDVKFASTKKYVLTITISAEEGYAFAEGITAPQLGGATATGTIASGTLTYEFQL